MYENILKRKNSTSKFEQVITTMAKSANIEKENQAFKILKRLRQETEEQTDISSCLNKIMGIIAEEMGYDEVSCFVLLEENILELFATSGYNAEAKHKVTIRMGE